jgi:predicted nuclease of predicted toxin-antitoxin system
VILCDVNILIYAHKEGANPFLIAGGHDATHIRDHGMASASDLRVLAKAAADGLTLITADRGDFGRELALTRAVEPSVILLRQLPDVVRASSTAACSMSPAWTWASASPDVYRADSRVYGSRTS